MSSDLPNFLDIILVLATSCLQDDSLSKTTRIIISGCLGKTTIIIYDAHSSGGFKKKRRTAESKLVEKGEPRSRSDLLLRMSSKLWLVVVMPLIVSCRAQDFQYVCLRFSVSLSGQVVRVSAFSLSVWHLPHLSFSVIVLCFPAIPDFVSSGVSG